MRRTRRTHSPIMPDCMIKPHFNHVAIESWAERASRATVFFVMGDLLCMWGKQHPREKDRRAVQSVAVVNGDADMSAIYARGEAAVNQNYPVSA